MKRVWSRSFALFTAPISVDQIDSGKANALLGINDPTLVVSSKRFGLPNHLRWVSHPLLGFPRAPFEVFRRIHVGKPDTRLRDAPVQAFGNTAISWPGEMIEVQFAAAPQSGSSLRIDALDAANRKIPGQRIVFTTPGTGSFISQGIQGLSIAGFGTVSDVRGMEQNAFANLAHWERFAVVGLPYRPGEVGQAVYDTTVQQGFEGSLTDGFAAGIKRLAVNALLASTPPDNGIPDFPTPDWPTIDPALFMNQLRDVTPSLLRLITNCLEESDDTDPGKWQGAHSEMIVLEGLHPVGSDGSATDTASTEIKVTEFAMLGVSTDGDTAAGLGYGVTDLPPSIDVGVDPHRRPPGIVRPPLDYMVVAKYVFPFIGSVELAALGVPRPPPATAENLEAAKFLTDLPAGLDQPEMEAVQLTFDQPLMPQGFAIAKSMAPGQAEVVNTKRLLSPGFDPFVPLVAESVEGDPPADSQSRFIDVASPVPLSGSATRRYIVAGIDVFNRFSGWQLAKHVSIPQPVQKPGLDAVSLATDLETAQGHVLTGQVTIDFSWNWADRSPDRVVLRSRFFPFNHASAPGSAPGFAMDSDPGAPVAPDLVIKFDLAGAPAIDSGHTGVVNEIQMTPPSEEARRYRVSIEQVRLDFSTTETLALAVFAQGAERVRTTQLSTQVGPRTTNISDPVPADNPTLPLEILWTALPDAARIARAHLRWTPTAGAAGYFIWQATETALRHTLAPQAEPPGPTDTLVGRATSLRDLLIAPGAYERSLSQFARLNERKIAGDSVELELPGGADSLYVYRVSTITNTGVESERSIAFVIAAVPSQTVPGTPRLIARVRRDEPPGIELVAFSGPGPMPAGFRVHRIASASVVGDIGRMGPPVIPPDDADWTSVDEAIRPGGPTEPARAIHDVLEPSWMPQTYRLVAVGAEDLSIGQIAGESEPSNAQTIVLFPDGAPAIEDIEVLTSASAGASHRVINLRTNLPPQVTPLGTGFLRVDQTALSSGGVARSPVFEAATADLERGLPFDPEASLSAAELAELPIARRGDVDADGRFSVSLRVPLEVSAGVILATDPLGRSAIENFSVTSP